MMVKVTLNTRTLYKNVSLLKSIALAEYGNPQFKGVLCFVADENGLSLNAGPGSIYMSIQLSTEPLESSYCFVDYTLQKLLKVAKGDEITLTMNEHLQIKDERGLKAKLNGMALPFIHDKAIEISHYMDTISVDVDATDLMDFAQVALAFTSITGVQYVSLKTEDGTLYASTHTAENGGVESYPLATTDEVIDETVKITPNYLISFLQFIDHTCTLRIPRTMTGSMIMISDPDNPAWWGWMGRRT